MAGEEAVHAVAVVDKHLHAARTVDADEVKGVGFTLELVCVADLAGAKTSPDGSVTGAGVLGGGVEDGALGTQERQVGALRGDDELRLGLILVARAGPGLGDPQRRLFHRQVDGVEAEAPGVVVPDGNGCINVLSGNDPVLVLVGTGPRRGGGEGQEEGERSRADASQV